MTDMALLSVAAVREQRATWYPAVANTWAKPGPMVPAPNMATFLTSARPTWTPNDSMSAGRCPRKLV